MFSRVTLRHTTSQTRRSLRSWNSPNKIVTVITGDGIGPELCQSAIGVVQASGAPVSFEVFDSTLYSDVLSSDIVASFSRNEVGLKGPLVTQKGQNSRNQRLRKLFALETNMFHCKSINSLPTRHKNVDIVVVRENIEGEYTGMESEIVPGVVQSIKVTTTTKSRQIAEHAFNFAKQNGRKKVTAIHKANIMKLTDGLFLEQCREVAKGYPDIQFNEMIIDNTCMQLVMNPSQFDVMVTPNLYGNIVSNVLAGLIGGPGLVSGQNIGHRVSVFETGARHTGSDLTGKNLANPTGMIFSAVNMLRFIGQEKYAKMIEDAVYAVYEENKCLTLDVGGHATTKQFTEAIIGRLAKTS